MAIQNSTRHEAAAADTRKQLEILRATVKKIKEAGDIPSLTVSNDYFPAYVEPAAALNAPIIETPSHVVPEYPAVHQPEVHNVALDSAIAHAIEEVAVKREADPETLALAKALTKLADLYGRKKMIHEMEPLLIEALRIKEGIYGGDHLS